MVNTDNIISLKLYCTNTISLRPHLFLLPFSGVGQKPSNTFLGSYKLKYDRSWTPLSKVNERERDIGLIHKAMMSVVANRS